MNKDLVICFDFDGTLCEYKGWRGHSKIGEPLRHLEDDILIIDVVKELYEVGVILYLSTTRLNPFPFGQNLDTKGDEIVISGMAKEYIENWLTKWEIIGCFKEITGFKPYADKYIDDRGWFPTRQELLTYVCYELGEKIKNE